MRNASWAAHGRGLAVTESTYGSLLKTWRELRSVLDDECVPILQRWYVAKALACELPAQRHARARRSGRHRLEDARRSKDDDRSAVLHAHLALLCANVPSGRFTASVAK